MIYIFILFFLIFDKVFSYDEMVIFMDFGSVCKFIVCSCVFFVSFVVVVVRFFMMKENN